MSSPVHPYDNLTCGILIHFIAKVDVGCEEFVSYVRAVLSETSPHIRRGDNFCKALSFYMSIGPVHGLTLIDSGNESQVAGTTLLSFEKVGV